MAVPTQTTEGIKLASWSLLLYFVAEVLTLAGAVVLVAWSLLRPEDVLGLLGVSGGLGIPAGILIFVLVILFLVGFFTLYANRREFGPAHEKNMDRSLILFILVIVAFLAVWAVYFALFFFAFVFAFLAQVPDGSPPTGQELLETLGPVLLLGAGLDILLAFLVALLLYLTVVVLLPSAHRLRLRLAVWLFVGGSAVGFAAFAILYLTGHAFVPALEGPPSGFVFSFPLQEAIGGLLKAALQTVAAFLLWQAYAAAHGALRTGGVTPPGNPGAAR